MPRAVAVRVREGQRRVPLFFGTIFPSRNLALARSWKRTYDKDRSVYAHNLKGLTIGKTADLLRAGHHPHDVRWSGNRLGLVRPAAQRLVGHEQGTLRADWRGKLKESW